MGCDIHASAERKANNRESWDVAAHFPMLPRWYRLFGALVDGHARGGDAPGVAPERGFPEDADHLSVSDDDGSWGAGGADHTKSWLTPAEFREALTRVDCDCPEYLAVAAYLDALSVTGEARLLFGFDN